MLAFAINNFVKYGVRSKIYVGDEIFFGKFFLSDILVIVLRRCVFSVHLYRNVFNLKIIDYAFINNTDY